MGEPLGSNPEGDCFRVLTGRRTISDKSPRLFAAEILTTQCWNLALEIDGVHKGCLDSNFQNVSQNQFKKLSLAKTPRRKLGEFSDSSELGVFAPLRESCLFPF